MAFKKLTAGLMASSMILGLAAQASAEITTSTAFETAVKMNKLGIVIGQGTLPGGEIDFNLGGNLTRAELVTTIVRSFGADQAAQLAKGAPSFADVEAGAWYSGYVAVAKNLAEQAGTTIGRDANHFDPTANVSKAEALVFVMKFLGINVTSSGENWYEAWIAKAVELGLISAADAEIALANPGSAAHRGEAFIILDFGYSAKVLEGGKSLYTAFVDSTLPVVEVAAPAESTVEGKITISGKVSDNKGVASVAVNGHAVEVKDGNFSAEVELRLGANSIVVTATDIAGNTASKTFTVSRVNAAAAGLEAADITVAAGAEAHVSAKLVDANGAEIAGAEITGASNVGTYEAGKFTAGEKAGVGTLTLTYGELTKEVKVTVTAGELAHVEGPAGLAPNKVGALKATDAYGNAIAGATFAVSGTDKAFVDGSGNFFASAAGSYTVTATVGGKSVEGKVGVYGDVASFKFSAPSEMVANGATEYEITATAVDADGNSVANYKGNVTLSGPYGNVATKAAKDGSATFKFVAHDDLVGEEAAFKASTLIDGVTYSGSTKINVVAQVATSVKASIVGGAKYLPSNHANGDDPETANVKFTVLDQLGKAMLDGEWTAQLAITGPAVFEDTGKTSKADVGLASSATFEIKASEEGVTGAITITATVEGLTSKSATITAAVAQTAAAIQVTAGDVDEIEANADNSEYVSYYVQITDKYGVPVKAEKELKVSLEGITGKDFLDSMGDATVEVVRYSIGETGEDDELLFDAVDAPAKAKATAFFTVDTDENGKAEFHIATQKAGTFTVAVTDTDAKPLTAGGKLSFDVVAQDEVAQLHRVTNRSVWALRGKPASLKFAVADQFGNKITKSGVAVNFIAGVFEDGDFTPTSTATVEGKNASNTNAPVVKKTDANGEVSVDFVGSLLLGNYGVIGYIGDFADEDSFGDAIYVAVGAAIPASVTTKVQVSKDGGATWADYSGTIEIEQHVRVVATVKDQDGYAFDFMGAGDFDLVSSADEDLSDVGFNHTGNGVYTTDAIEVTQSGSQKFTVELATLQSPVKVDTRSISVKAGAPFGIIVAGLNADDELAVEKNKAQEVTVQLVDKKGNVVSATGVAKWHVSFDGVTYSDGGAHYISVRDANGTEMFASGIDISANRNVTKFFLLTDDVNAKFTITVTIGGVDYDTEVQLVKK